MKTKIAIFLLVGSSFCMLAQGGLNGGFSSSYVEIGRGMSDSLAKDSRAADSLLKDTILSGLREMAADSAGHVPDSVREKVAAPDSIGAVVTDSVQTDSVAEDTAKVSKSVLDQPVEYTASDSVTFEAGLGNANLYGNSKVNYTNLELQADWITMNMDSSIVHAVGRPDSTGKVQNQPVFKQGSDQYEPERISYNFKTRKAFIDNVYTQQGDGFLISEESKRDAEGVMYVRHGKYTTCNAKHPHFYMALTVRKYVRERMSSSARPIWWWRMYLCRWPFLTVSSPSVRNILQDSSCLRSAMKVSVGFICAMADIISPSTI